MILRVVDFAKPQKPAWYNSLWDKAHTLFDIVNKAMPPPAWCGWCNLMEDHMTNQPTAKIMTPEAVLMQVASLDFDNPIYQSHEECLRILAQLKINAWECLNEKGVGED